MYAKIAYRFWKKRSTPSSVCSLSCEKKKWKKLASSSINPSMKSQKQCEHPRILLLWQKVCVKRLWYDAIQSPIVSGVEANWPIDVFASLSRPVIDLQRMPILAKKKIIFSDEAHFDLSGYVNKQNCRIWGTENPHTLKSRHTQNVQSYN